MEKHLKCLQFNEVVVIGYDFLIHVDVEEKKKGGGKVVAKIKFRQQLAICT